MSKRKEVRGKHARIEPTKEELQARANAQKEESKRRVAQVHTNEQKEESKRRVEQLNAQQARAAAGNTVAPDFKPQAKPASPVSSTDATVAVPKVTAQVAPVGMQQAAPLGADSSFFAAQQVPAFNAEKPKKDIPTKKILTVLGIIVGVLLLIYVAGGLFFSSHFLPRTIFDNQDVSLKSISATAEIMENAAADYSVQVKGEGLNFTVTSQDMDVKIDGESVAKKALESENAWTWPASFFTTHDITESLAASYNDSGLRKIVESQVEAVNENAEDPTNASLEYSEEDKSFEIVAEKAGTKLDSEAVLKVVDEAATNLKTTAEITDEQLLQPSITKDDERLATAQETANNYVKADLNMTIDGTSVGEINADQISQWVTVNEDAEAVFDEDAMNTWLTDYGNSLDTIGTERSFTRADGKEITVEGGTYGWEVDTEAVVNQVRDAIVNGTVGDFEIPLADSETSNSCTSYNPGGVEWSDYVDVDLSEQHARYYDGDGNLLWESDTVTGMPDGEHNTPTGVWEILYKESPATLKGDVQVATGQPEYETQVTYWMPFTGSGCGFHDATWQPGFGGSLYAEGYGSHGCVNLPYDAAASLYDLLPGDNSTAVVVHE